MQRCNVPRRDDQFGYPHVAGRRFEKSNFSNTPVAIQRQFEDFNHINADATDETKIVKTKFALGFCHGQLQFCLLVQIGPKTAPVAKLLSWQQQLRCRVVSFVMDIYGAKFQNTALIFPDYRLFSFYHFSVAVLWHHH